MKSIEFLEESNHLEKDIDTITGEIKRLGEKISDLREEMGRPNYDYEDVSNWQDTRDKYYSDNRRVQELNTSLPCPYFARLDLYSHDLHTQEKTIKTHYIGKQGCYIGTETIAVDWRTEVGSIYYNSFTRDIQLNEILYELRLKRSLDISDSMLIGCTTEYDSLGKSEEEKSVVDSFLNELLKRKRKTNRLTDIIQTIQKKQNLIIRRPIDENFVIQGCAGSGKTMIMLHRLSFLHFNEKTKLQKLNPIILTPSETFNRHIEQLCKELEIGYIRKMNVDELFQHLLLKITGSRPSITSEKGSETREQKHLNELYTFNFQNRVKEVYAEIWQEQIQKLEQSWLGQDILQTVRRKTRVENYNGTVYEQLRSTAQENIHTMENNRKQFRELEKEFQMFEVSEKNWDQKVFNHLSYELRENRKNILRMLNEKIDDLEAEISKVNSALSNIQMNINGLQSEISYLTGSLGEVSKAVQSTKKQQFAAAAERILKPKVRKMLERSANKAFLEIIKQAEIDLNKYKGTNTNIEKKSLMKDLSIFVNRCNPALLNIKKKFEQRISADQKKINKLSAEASQFKLKNLKSRKRFFADLKDIWKLDMNYFPSPSKLSRLNEIDPVLYDAYLKRQELQTQLSRMPVNPKEFSHTRKEYEELLSDMQKRMNSSDEELSLSTMNEILQLEYSVLLRKVRERVFMESPSEKRSLKHIGDGHFSLYFQLLISSLYFPLKSQQVTGYLCIDEGQNLSPAEYSLLKTILGNNCIFNIYGDTMQAIDKYRSIDDWREINFLKLEKYELNENYRNTVQISKFCNKQFKKNFVSIGLSGAELYRAKDLNEAMKKAESISLQDKKSRIAIIYSGWNENINEIHDIIKKYCEKLEMLSFSRALSIMSTAQARGLEFDCVIAITSWMDKNELYITYTRALDNLILCEKIQ